ncbi:MAG: non-homologous end-joining DNA ligase [Nitriliruptoraceae bacterium]
MTTQPAPTVVRVDGRELRVTNPDKVLFPAAGITKRQLVAHQLTCAEVMLPLVADRPLTLRRYPDGIDGDGWFQKHPPPGLPSWVQRASIPRGSAGERIEHVVVDGVATLVYLANLAAIELHIGPAPVQEPDHPRELVVDLDPPPGAEPPVVRRATRRVQAVLDELGMASRLKTTGSAGFHVHVPLNGAATQALARDVAKAVATITARRHPGELTVEHRRARRTGRVLIDWFRNSPAQTAIAPYSVRARPSAPVATPMDWSELGRTQPQRWTITSLPRRLARQGDVWADPVAASDLHELAPTIAAALAEA